MRQVIGLFVLRVLVMAFSLLVYLCGFHVSPVSAGGDNSAPVSVGEKPAVLTTSYFQGTWVGVWEWGGSNKGNDLSIKIGPKNPDGTFDVEYYSGPYHGVRTEMAYTVNIKGKEVGDTFEFEFNNPKLDFRKSYITMTKLEGDRAKAKSLARNTAVEAILRRK